MRKRLILVFALGMAAGATGVQYTGIGSLSGQFALGMVTLAAVLAGAAARLWWSRLQRLEQALRQAAADKPFSIPLTGGDPVSAIVRAIDGMSRNRDEAEAALRASERRLAELGEAARQWIWETDADGQITHFSTLASRRADLQGRHLLGQRFTDIAEPPQGDPEAWTRHAEDLAAFRPFHDFVFRIRAGGGNRLTLRSSGKPLFGEDGGFAGYLGVATDVTTQIAAEQRGVEARRLMMDALREARETAEHANRGKSRFLAAASHDLRQPLQALGLYLATLGQRPMPGDQAALVDKMSQSLDALEHQLDTLLDISRLDAGLIEPHPAVFPAQHLFDRLATEFEPLAQSKGLSIRFSQTSAFLRSDPALLERILRSLLSNALRYTSRGGVVVGCRRREDVLRLEVWDSGRGIPLQEQRSVFQEFRQLGTDGNRPPPDGGLGLGLTIVNRLAGLLSHRIELLSVPGRGSVFTVVIQASPEDRRPPPQKTRQAGLVGRQALVLDDDPVIRDGLRAILEIWGLSVVTAENAEDAQRAIGKGCVPDILIADYRLRGGRNGADAVRLIREMAGNEIPAIIITGDTSPERLAQATGSGLALMHKPVRPDQLKDTLQNLIDAQDAAHAEQSSMKHE